MSKITEIKQNLRKERMLELGLEEDEELAPLNLAIIGYGGLAKQEIIALANNMKLLPVQIDNIYYIKKTEQSPNEKMWQERELGTIFQPQHNFNHQVQIKNITYGELNELIPQINMIQFTASYYDKKYHKKEEFSRIKMSEYNLELFDILKNQVPNMQNFKGTAIFKQNIPEVHAHQFAKIYGFENKDIIANSPISRNRLRYLLNKDQLLDEQLKTISQEEIPQITQKNINFDGIPIGYHGNSHIIIFKPEFGTYQNQYGTKTKINLSYELDEDVKQSLNKAVNAYGKNQLELFSNTNLPGNPTDISAGNATAQLITDILTGEKTIAGIPYEIDGKTFFVNLPIHFKKGYAQIDEEQMMHLTEQDKDKLEDIIIEKQQTTKQEMYELDKMGGAIPLETLIKNTIKGDYAIKAPNKKNPIQTTKKQDIILNFTNTQDIQKMCAMIQELQKSVQDKNKQEDTDYMQKLNESLTNTMLLLKGDALYTLDFHKDTSPAITKITDSLRINSKRAYISNIILLGNKIYAINKDKTTRNTTEHYLMEFDGFKTTQIGPLNNNLNINEIYAFNGEIFAITNNPQKRKGQIYKYNASKQKLEQISQEISLNYDEELKFYVPNQNTIITTETIRFDAQKKKINLKDITQIDATQQYLMMQGLGRLIITSPQLEIKQFNGYIGSLNEFQDEKQLLINDYSNNIIITNMQDINCLFQNKTHLNPYKINLGELNPHQITPITKNLFLTNTDKGLFATYHESNDKFKIEKIEGLNGTNDMRIIK
ncbi:MAG: hypothetical protein ACLFN8_04560 [Candidatus Woesearchaeota archaeon]